MAQQMDLPPHMYTVASEEHLLLSAFRRLACEAGHVSCPPAITMASRNDLIALARDKLDAPRMEAFIAYATALNGSLPGSVIVAFPPPVGDFSPCDPAAEQLAWQHLQEGQGSIWSSVREVVSALDFHEDGRACADGLIFTLGAYVVGGITGLTRHTSAHVNVCRLLSRMVKLVCPGLQWTSLAVLIDNKCGPHHDRWNWRGLSLLIGLSHHDAGGLWIEAPGGRYYEMVGNDLVAGDIYPTSATGLAFLSKTQLHATCDWTGGNRVVMLAYCIGQFQSLSVRTHEELAELGFELPKAARDCTRHCLPILWFIPALGLVPCGLVPPLIFLTCLPSFGGVSQG